MVTWTGCIICGVEFGPCVYTICFSVCGPFVSCQQLFNCQLCTLFLGCPALGQEANDPCTCPEECCFFDAAQEGTGLMVCLLQSPVSDLGSGSPRAAGLVVLNVLVGGGFLCITSSLMGFITGVERFSMSLQQLCSASLVHGWRCCCCCCRLVPTLCFLLPLGESFILCY